MYEFFRAAFPWVIMGVAIAFFGANHQRIKRSKMENEDGEEAQDNYMTEGRNML